MDNLAERLNSLSIVTSSITQLKAAKHFLLENIEKFFQEEQESNVPLNVPGIFSSRKISFKILKIIRKFWEEIDFFDKNSQRIHFKEEISFIFTICGEFDPFSSAKPCKFKGGTGIP